MGLLDKLYKKNKLEKEKEEFKWREDSVFYIANCEIVNRTFRQRFLGNWFNNQEEMDTFKNNLYKDLIKFHERERKFLIKGEETYDSILDVSTIEKSLLFRDGIIFGYKKAYETERKELVEEFNQKISPEQLEISKKNYKSLFLSNLFFGSILILTTSLFCYSHFYGI
ncbi:hypothetical protein J4412_01100, partial [Candidatus Pacearchaeota archaeon]|nr:hypothetical protein [Candidatus Pacearchaeota archaeon]